VDPEIALIGGGIWIGSTERLDRFTIFQDDFPTPEEEAVHR
jgi:hypothetical protein